MKRIAFFVVLLFMATSVFGKFGVSIEAKWDVITIHANNYNFYLSNFKPDYAEASFINNFSYRFVIDSINRNQRVEEKEYGFIYFINIDKSDINKSAQLNKLVLDKLLSLKKIASFNSSYYKIDNNYGKICYRYIQLQPNSIVKKDMLLINVDSLKLTIENQEYYKNGALLKKSSFEYLVSEKFFPTKIVTDEHFKSGKANRDSLFIWYTIPLSKWKKEGTHQIFYATGENRLTEFYNNGTLMDTVYHELYPNGKIKKTYSIKAGKLNGLVQQFDDAGKSMYTANYKAGILINQTYLSGQKQNTKKALLIAIGDFENKQLPKINTDNDIDLLQTALVNRGFTAKNIITIKGLEGNKKTIIEAFKKLQTEAKEGDILFIHFSTMGFILKEEFTSEPALMGYVIPTTQGVSPEKIKALGASAKDIFILQSDIEAFITGVKKKLGSAGQLLLSFDTGSEGVFLDTKNTGKEKSKNDSIATRGESNNLLLNIVAGNTCNSAIFTATSSDSELAYEIRGEDGKSYGGYSYFLAQSIMDITKIYPVDIHYNIVNNLAEKNQKQNPGFLSNDNFELFETAPIDSTSYVSLPVIKPTGNAYVVAVGISQYNTTGSSGNLNFTNCATDASGYADFFQNQFTNFKGDSVRFQQKSIVLLNQKATKDSIINAINYVISNSKPDDYFVFNFSGYCKPLKDAAGKQVTYFVPYGLLNLAESSIRKHGIPLTQLKDLLQFIPANNQLFITEAGTTTDFQREFIQALIETSPTIAALSNKNRIFIVPKGSGLDNFRCRNNTISHGPLNYYITNLSEDLNVFGLFNGGVYADAVKYAINKTEADCDFFRTGYFDIFFEKEFVKDLKFFLPENVMQSRGAKLLELDRKAVSSAISKKYALVIGTDKYQGKPNWTDLNNPVFDATDLEKQLRLNYGYQTKLLIDKPADSIYESIVQLNKILQPTDQLVIFIAGHGDFDEKLFDDGFIVCTNSSPVAQDPYRNTYIQYSKLSRMINKLPAQQILMVLDVCFGGTFDERVARNGSRSDNAVYKDLGKEVYFTEKMKKKTRLYLTSGGKKEVPDGYKGQHSPFALRLLEALQGRGGAAGILTASDLYQFVYKLPSGPLLGSFGDDDTGSEFVLLAK
jgi:antitoxin component YwqK of YwqJK toxin-antitoxin module